ncbi:MAG: sigma-54 dependent transcriptional regulator [Pseudomonadota bacterium]
MSKCVLVVDDDPAQRRIVEATLKRSGYDVALAAGGEAAISLLEGPEVAKFDIVLLDLVMPETDGLAVLDRLRARENIPPVIVQTAHGSVDTAIQAMRAGAVDFVVKPVSPERLEVSLKNALKIDALAGEITRIKRRATGTLTFDDLVINGDAMCRVVDLGRRSASSTIPVLIEGESGVGKELIARAIQGESDRAGAPFVTVNCGAIPENLVESILFGHEKGAFTGASEKRKGKFVEADGGTLFLDEVGELPLDIQVKLLRALQEGEVDPVGGKKSVKVDFRLVSATNRDMIQLVKDGKFREDLYYRLNVFPVWVPPLRDRMDDVPMLVEHFITKFTAEEGKRIDGIAANALELLMAYSWPGNVRQLENTIFRAVVLADSTELQVADFPQIAAHVDGFSPEVPEAPAPNNDAPSFDGPALLGVENAIPETVELTGEAGRAMLGIPAVNDNGEIRDLEAIEADMIRLALGRYRGHMTKVAERLGIGRSTLYRKMKDYGLEARAS